MRSLPADESWPGSGARRHVTRYGAEAGSLPNRRASEQTHIDGFRIAWNSCWRGTRPPAQTRVASIDVSADSCGGFSQ